MGTAISNDGMIAGYASMSGQWPPFAWQESLGLVELPLPAGIQHGRPQAANGEFVVGDQGSPWEGTGLLWRIVQTP